MIRPSTPDDAEAIATIYAPVVEQTSISWELTPPSVDEMRTRLMDTLRNGYPYLVFEREGVVVGYAYASAFRGRPGYRFTCECTVYLHENAQGQGIGTQLYEALFDELRTRGFVTVIAGISLPNPASESLHAKLGFRKVAHFDRIGHKLDAWWDAAFYQLDLSPDRPTPPQENPFR